MISDIVNGIFEIIGGLFILNHCRVLYKDKQVKGVSVLSTVVFTLWGFCNLYFYPSLNQMISFVGGVIMVIANTLYVGMLIHYSRDKFRQPTNIQT